MNLNAMLGVAITKGAARVVRRPLADLRHDVAALKRTVKELKQEVARLRRAASLAPKAAATEVANDGSKKMPRMRPTGAMVRKLRAKLGLTQTEFAKLAGVSMLSVSKWERTDGRINLRGRTLSGLGRMRGLSKRTARKELGGQAE